MMESRGDGQGQVARRLAASDATQRARRSDSLFFETKISRRTLCDTIARLEDENRELAAVGMGNGRTKAFELDAPDDYDYYFKHHSVTDPETGKEVFHAGNLADCPEDAIIGRDIFDAHDWVDVVNYGIELAKAGYDKAELVEVKNED